MQIHNLKPKNKAKNKKRVGRGGKRGTYSGKGVKGQKSRAGRTTYPSIREIIKKYPKLRGYRQNWKKNIFTAINVSLLEENFKTGDKVSPKILLEKKIISKIKTRMPFVKILGNGEIKKKLIIENCSVSKTAKQKIEKAGGTIK